MKKYISYLLLAITVFSCDSTKKISKNLNTWIGHTKQEVIMSWGPPTQTTSDGNSGEILVYAHRVYYTLPNATPTDYWEYRMLYVNSSDKIYHWLFRRNPNPPERIDVRILAR